jgi:hypothetical protein
MKAGMYYPHLFGPFVLITSRDKSYLALRLKDQDLRDARQQAAKAFIHNSLYGPGTNRTTGNFIMDYFSFLLQRKQRMISNSVF